MPAIKPVGKPDAGNPHVRFDERGGETGRANGTAPLLDSTLPFLIFRPRRLRFVAAFGILLLQGCIVLTGNYNRFNLQTMLLCLILFDDATIRDSVPGPLVRLLPFPREIPPLGTRNAVAVNALGS
jgi:hypothetical protein